MSEGAHLSTHNPGTGLPYVSWNHLSTKVREPFAPLFKGETAKVVYYFAVVMKISHIVLPQQRVLLITHDSIVQCTLNGDVTRCAPIADIEDVIISHDNWFGIAIPTPKQVDMLFKLSSQQVAYMRQVLSVLYKHLSGKDLKFTQLRETANIKGMLKLQKPPKFRVQLPSLQRKKDVIKDYQKRTTSSIRSTSTGTQSQSPPQSPFPLKLAPPEADSPMLSPRSPQPVPVSSIEHADEGPCNIPRHSPSGVGREGLDIKCEPVPPPDVTAPSPEPTAPAQSAVSSLHTAPTPGPELPVPPVPVPVPIPVPVPAPAAAPVSADLNPMLTTNAYQQRLREIESHQSRTQPPARSPSPPCLEGKFKTGTTVLTFFNNKWAECRVVRYSGQMYTLSHSGATVTVPEGRLRPCSAFKKGDLVSSTRRLYSEGGDVIPEGGAGTVLSVPGENPSAAAVIEMAGYRLNVGPADIEVLAVDEYNEGDELEVFDLRGWRPCTVILKEGGTYLVQTEECEHFNIDSGDVGQYLRERSDAPPVAPEPTSVPEAPVPVPVHVPEPAPTPAPSLPEPTRHESPPVYEEPASQGPAHGTLVLSADQYQSAPMPAPAPSEPLKQSSGRKAPPRSHPGAAAPPAYNLAEGLPTSFAGMMEAPYQAPVLTREEASPQRRLSVHSEARSHSPSVRAASSERDDVVSLDFANKVFDDYSRQVKELQNKLTNESHDHNVVTRLTVEREMLMKKIDAIRRAHDIDMRSIDDDFGSLPQSMTPDGVQKWLLGTLLVSDKLANCFKGVGGLSLHAMSEDVIRTRVGGNAAAASMLYGQLHKEAPREADTAVLKWVLASRRGLVEDLAAGYERLRSLKLSLKKATKAHGTMQEKLFAADKQAVGVVKAFKDIITNYVLPQEKIDLGYAESCDVKNMPPGILSPFEEGVLSKLRQADTRHTHTMYISPPHGRVRRTSPRKARGRSSPSRSVSPMTRASRTPPRSLTPLSAFGRTASRTRTVTPPSRSVGRSVDRY